MGGGRLLIFYVTNVCYVTKVISSAFCRILRHILPHFAADFPAQKPYLCTEFQSALKFQNKHVNC